MITDVNQGLKTRTSSVPKNPEFEPVILHLIQNLFENWRCQHQKDSASVANVVRLVRNDLPKDFFGTRAEKIYSRSSTPYSHWLYCAVGYRALSPLFSQKRVQIMSSQGPFRVLSILGTTCRIIGWLLVVLAVIAGITAIVTASGWQNAVAGAGVFVGSLVGGMLLVAQGQLIKAILTIERNTRP